MSVGVKDCRNSEISGAKTDFSGSQVGILHFGVGAFHRAHQAVYTHDVLEKNGGDWRILGVSLRSTGLADDLNRQEGAYSLIIRGKDSNEVRIIKSLKSVVAAVHGMNDVFRCLCAAETKIVSMTLTEKAYGIDQNGGLDLTHEAVKHDLTSPENPKGIIGIITRGLKLRKESGLKAFTVLCCDNLSQNGDLVRGGVLNFANQIGELELADWIAHNATFPNTMVDRITPATTEELKDEVEHSFGVRDAVPVETEAFTQWVIEDNFAAGRPEWEDVGVLFVDDVKPYEHAKLRILNGAHSLIAYAGFLSGKKYVRDVMADDQFCDLVRSYMKAAVGTLEPLEHLVYQDYVEQLIDRFKNPNIAHETYQIAMDGSQKMPQRIFSAAVDALERGADLQLFAFATAVWIRYCSGIDEEGVGYQLRDPRQEELVRAFDNGSNVVPEIVENFLSLPSLFPEQLIQSEEWNDSVSYFLKSMIEQGAYASLIK